MRQQDAVIARQEAALASRAEYLYRNVRTHSHVKCFLHESSRATVLRRFLHRPCAGSAHALYLLPFLDSLRCAHMPLLQSHAARLLVAGILVVGYTPHIHE